MTDYTPYQKKIIDRYYKNFDAIKHQQLSELATELYLSEGKKTDRLWKRVEEVSGSSSSPSRESPTCWPSAIPRFSWEFLANLKEGLPRNHEAASACGGNGTMRTNATPSHPGARNPSVPERLKARILALDSCSLQGGKPFDAIKYLLNKALCLSWRIEYSL